MGVKKDTAATASTDSKLKALGLKLDLLHSDHMLAGRWFVDDVTADSPVAKAGIVVKDVLMKIGTEDVISVKASPSDQEVEAKLEKVCCFSKFHSI